MANPIATAGGTTTHGGVAPVGSLDVRSGGTMVLRKNDLATCPLHGPGKIAQHSSSVQANGAPVARMGDQCACGSVGKAGAGLPATVNKDFFEAIMLMLEGAKTGQGLPDIRVTTDAAGRMPSEIAEGQVGHSGFGIEFKDVNQDGLVDSVRVEGVGVGARIPWQHENAAFSAKGYFEVTAGMVNGSLSQGLGAKGALEGALTSLVAAFGVQSKANPADWIKGKFDLSIISGSASASNQIAGPGTVGISSGGGVSGKVIGASLKGEVSQSFATILKTRFPLADRVLNYSAGRGLPGAKRFQKFLEKHSLEMSAKGGVSGGSAGVEGQFEAGWDGTSERVFLNAEGVLEYLIGLGIDIGISAGRGQDLDGNPAAPQGGAAALTKGTPTVRVGG